MKLIKATKIIFVLTIISILLTAGLLGGIQVEQNRLKQEEQLETVEEIAIVNLDEGIYSENGKINYASELMEFPGDNFVSTSLEEARNGIYDGSYAAYIIIPASFSANAESINSTPQKSVMEYAINPNLRSEVSNRVIADVKNFESTISRNLSYMYMDAVLKEFHDVQDSAQMIMANDKKDLEALNEVDPSQMIELLELSEIERVEDEIEDIDLSDVYSDNQKTIEQTNEKVKESITQGQEEFEKVKSGEEKVQQSAESLMSDVNEMNLLNGADGAKIYDEGLQQIGEYLTTYNTSVMQTRNDLKLQLGKNEKENAGKETILVSDRIQENVDVELEKIKNIIEEKSKEFNEELRLWKEYLLGELEWLKFTVEDAKRKDTVSGVAPLSA